MNALCDQLRQDYDSIPYVSRAYFETHPGNLSALAFLQGLTPALPSSCRVLEIGSSSGGNLLPMAAGLPESSFVGLDFSSRSVASAESRRLRLGLSNIEFSCIDLLEFKPAPESFDFIIAHGFYSWVPLEVRNAFLDLCAVALKPQGIAYVSYNTYPGWHLKRAVRDLMLFSGGEAKTPEDRLKAAQNALEFCSQESAGNPIYKQVIRDANSRIRGQANVLHDELEAVNDPTYFVDFVRHAGEHNLRYVSHAIPGADVLSVPPALRNRLSQISADPIRREQMADFLNGRSFRTSMLCRVDAGQSPERGADRVMKMHAAGWLVESTSPAQMEMGPWGFQSKPASQVFQVNNADVARVLRRLLSAWPRSVAVAEVAAAGNTSLVLEALQGLFEHGLIELRTEPTPHRGTAGGNMPSVTKVAREQALSGELVTNLRHQEFKWDAQYTRFLPLMDGTRNRSQLLSDFRKLKGPAPAGFKGADDAENQKQFDELMVYLSENSLLV